MAGDDRLRATAATAIVELLNRRSLHRDVRAELIAAAAILRPPPALIRRGMTPAVTPTPSAAMRRGAPVEVAEPLLLSVMRRSATG